MKRRIPLIGLLMFLTILFALSACWFTGCGQRTDRDSRDGRQDSRLRVVTTLFPYYDFVRQIAGDRVRLKLVVPAGMDSHSFEPTPADMMTIQNADVLVYNGGEMEHWMDQVLESVDTTRMKVICMMDYVDALEEEHVEGMEPEDDDGHFEAIAYDEHIWTSPARSIGLVQAICGGLKEADPENAAGYEANALTYIGKLEEMDRQLRQTVESAGLSIIVVADKFPFRYLADDYGLAYRAAFSGCSTDTEPSAKTIAYLVDKVRDEGIPAVYYLELSSRRVAEIIGEETGASPLLLHSCHNVTRREFDDGVTYLQLMRQNVENLRRGLTR